MARHIMLLGTLTIQSGQSYSNVIESKIGTGHIVDLIFYGPSALTGTVTVVVGATEGLAASALLPLSVAGSVQTLAAAQATQVSAAAFRAIALSSNASEGAARAFTVLAQVELE